MTTIVEQKQAYFSPKTQFENVGDALITRELIHLSSMVVPTVVDLSRSPGSFRKTMGIEGFASHLPSSTIAFFRDLLVSTMSGTRCFYFLSPGGYAGGKSIYRMISAWANTAVLVVLRQVGVRICHVGVSYERLGPAEISLLRFRSKLLHAHFVRDIVSLNYCKTNEIKVNGIMPDLAFGMAAEQSLESSSPKSRLAFSFRADQHADQLSFFKALVRKLDVSVPVDTDFVFVSQVRRDEQAVREVMQELRMHSNRPTVFVDGSGDIDTCLDAYKSCTHVIANRLHAILLGALAGAIAVGVGGESNQKIRGLFQTLDISKNFVDDSSSDAAAEIVSAVQSGELSKINFRREAKTLLGIFRNLFE